MRGVLDAGSDISFRKSHAELTGIFGTRLRCPACISVARSAPGARPSKRSRQYLTPRLSHSIPGISTRSKARGALCALLLPFISSHRTRF
jgi:hypothetical protein